MIRRLVLALAVIGTAAPAAPSLKLERVVVLMRHGVRPPTKDPAMPEHIARDPWPRWSVPPGELTSHGAAAIRLLAAADRRWFEAEGLFGKGCPAPGEVRMLSDSEQRTIATGDAYLVGLAPGCGITNGHRPQGGSDPLFAAAGDARPLDPARADQAVRAAAGPGGIAAVQAEHRALLDRMDAILCGKDDGERCGLRGKSTELVPATATSRPKLSGALDRASTAAQILLLEYAEGKPMTEVGWGRATPADVTALSRFHATEFALLARPPYLASRNSAPIAKAMIDALDERGSRAPKMLILVGHDTNVASLGGLLGVHWQAPGYASDDPPPGGALIIALLRNAKGHRFVRVHFRASSLDELRNLSPGPAYRQAMAISGCASPCGYRGFRKLVVRSLKRSAN